MTIQRLFGFCERPEQLGNEKWLMALAQAQALSRSRSPQWREEYLRKQLPDSTPTQTVQRTVQMRKATWTLLADIALYLIPVASVCDQPRCAN